MPKTSIHIEGLTPDQILDLSDDDLQELVFTGRSVVFRVGSATVLGQFQADNEALIVELAHIDGGGEGVLPSLWILADRYARSRQLQTVTWVVHAVHCVRPNPKLRPLLERRGFTIQTLESGIDAFCLTYPISASSSP